jgi:hypothetical protein
LLEPAAFCDADCAGIKSTTGFVFMLNGGGVILGAERSPGCMSTTEAEYIAAGMAAREGLLAGVIWSTAWAAVIVTSGLTTRLRLPIKSIESAGQAHRRGQSFHGTESSGVGSTAQEVYSYSHKLVSEKKSAYR